MTKLESSDFEWIPWNCPTCKEASQTFLGFRGGEFQRNGQGVKSSIYQCDQCQLLFPNPFPRPKNLAKIYGSPDTYFPLQLIPKKVELNGAILQKAKTWLGENFSLIDVGSGLGEMLEAARLAGLPARGIEVSPAMIAKSKELFPIFPELKTIATAAREWPQSFDLVVLNAVIEHVEDPDALIQDCKKLLRPGGYIYIDAPNEPNLYTKIGAVTQALRGSKGVYNLSPTWEPFHVYGFNRQSLNQLLTKHKFQLEEFFVFSPPMKTSKASLNFCLSILAKVANSTKSSANFTAWARNI